MFYSTAMLAFSLLPKAVARRESGKKNFKKIKCCDDDGRSVEFLIIVKLTIMFDVRVY